MRCVLVKPSLWRDEVESPEMDLRVQYTQVQLEHWWAEVASEKGYRVRSERYGVAVSTLELYVKM